MAWRRTGAGTEAQADPTATVARTAVILIMRDISISFASQRMRGSTPSLAAVGPGVPLLCQVRAAPRRRPIHFSTSTAAKTTADGPTARARAPGPRGSARPCRELPRAVRTCSTGISCQGRDVVGACAGSAAITPLCGASGVPGRSRAGTERRAKKERPDADSAQFVRGFRRCLAVSALIPHVWGDRVQTPVAR